MALRRVLIANRGEIATRIIRACRVVGAAAVVAYSDADADSPAVAMADTAVRLGPAPAADSYLSVEAVVSAALSAGCDAVHPGYGFLAEAPALAAACNNAGIVFVGPSAEHLRLLGDKLAARRLAADHGFELLTAAAVGDDITLPVMIKAVAGGGGRGMRLVTDASALAPDLISAEREAHAAFGDGSLYLERYLPDARHIEVQVLGDGRGRASHLGLRDCSLQRRHQKVMEEAPAPGIDAEEAARLGASACRMLSALRYRGAATVELLRAADGSVFFSEVNPRLQVEHPVTEAVTGEDIVAWQLRLAGGEPLPQQGLAWQPSGHAVEARLIAEDPDRGFVPAAGELLVFDLPDGVRIDAGYRQGSRIGTHYDGLLAKVVASAPTRTGALDQLAAALARVVVVGVATNLPLLSALVSDTDVRAGRLDTGLLERVWRPAAIETPPPQAVAAATALATTEPLAADPFAGRFRLGRYAPPALPTARSGSGVVHVLVEQRDVAVVARPPDTLEASASAGDTTTRAEIHAPMAGRVVSVTVTTGTRIDAGQPLLVLEAMKMEHPLLAPYAARVRAVHCAAGDTVTGGAVLIELEA